MIRLLDAIAIVPGRVIAVLGVLLAAVFAATMILDALIKRAGFGGLLLQWAFQEHAKEPRRWWAKLFWGKS